MKQLPIDEHEAEFLESVALAAVIAAAAKLATLDATRHPSSYPAARAQLVVACRVLAQLTQLTCEHSGLPATPALPEADDPLCRHGYRFSETCAQCVANHEADLRNFDSLVEVAEGKVQDWEADS
jgi:hypothetical protein